MGHQARGVHRHPRVVHPHSGRQACLDKVAAWQDRYQLTMWCEHADAVSRRCHIATAGRSCASERKAMTIRRVVPNIASDKLDACRDFYGLFGFQVAMDMGWIMTFVSP